MTHPLNPLAKLACFSLLMGSSLPCSQAQTAPAIHTTTRLVQLNVVVQNKHGAPIENLTKNHFTILDQGVPQQIAVFSALSNASRPPSVAPDLAPNVFTNRFDQSGQVPGSVTVILFDAFNTSFQDQASARQQVVKFLRQLRPQDHVALYILANKLITVNEFTQDSTTLLKAIDKFGGYSSAQLDAGNGPTRDEVAAESGISSQSRAFSPQTVDSMARQLASVFSAGEGQLQDYANVDRAIFTTRAMEAIANHVARIPGRKNLVWVSGSFPFTIGYDAESLMDPAREHRSFSAELEHAARALDQANMAVYPVDARGLMTPSIFNASNRTGISARNPVRPGDLSPIQDNFDTMLTIADRTGGRAFYNTNDLTGAIQRALADSTYTYTIGFYPSHGKWDGKFHELKVKVQDKDVTLRYRKGYFATPEPKDPAADNDENLLAATRSPVEWTNLDLQVTLKTLDPATRTLGIQIGFDTHELMFTPKDGRQVAKLFVVLGQSGDGNKSIKADKETFDLNLKQENYDKLMQIGTKFSGQLELDPNTVTLRVIGQDATSGAIGTLTIPIKEFLAKMTAAAAKQNLQQTPSKPTQ